MTDQIRDPSSLLSELQIERTLSLQLGIGAEAMCAAAKFADVLEVGEDVWRQIVTQTGVIMDANKIPFSIREEIREKYFELARLLGGEAVAYIQPPSDKYGLYIGNDEVEGQSPIAVVRTLDEVRVDEVGTDSDQATSRGLEAKPFDSAQEKWLRSLFNEEQVTSILEMTSEQRQAFIERMCDLYGSFDFRKKTNETRSEDVANIRQFLSGATYAEVAANLGKNYNVTYASIRAMAKTYLKFATDQQLAELVKLSEEQDERTLADAWLDEVAGENASEMYKQLTPDQKRNFISDLKELYVGLRLRRMTPEIKNKWSGIIEELLTGHSFELLAKKYAHGSKYRMNAMYDRLVEQITSQVPKDDIRNLIDKNLNN